MNIDELIGKAFITQNDEWYGGIQKLTEYLPDELKIGKATPIAEDEGGNIFLLKDEKVFFWDHEADEVIELASSFNVFKAGCVEEPEVQFNPDQVGSAWVDPKFAKEMGIDAPKDGWKKSPNNTLKSFPVLTVTFRTLRALRPLS
ncbi:MAG: SMI1/KNR4 family protein [Candidatus Thiodiazotropha sp. (ex Notomyrtea botanica)]|nr:SMI1/KNR4 family protein [Candidatus Thiodiazotropha sp. (ex Notomyrtea botanica)]